METKQSDLLKKDERTWMGLDLKWYVIFLVVTLAAVYLNKLPGGIVGGFTAASLIGILLIKIGDRIPILKDYLGGGAILAIFGGSAIAYFNILPEKTIEVMSGFVKQSDYFGLLVAGLISGAILGMDRKLLIKAGALFALPVLAGVVVAFGFAALGGLIMGFGAKNAILMVALPIMGGGTSAGAIPLSQIYGAANGTDPAQYLSMIMPAVVLGNAFAIVAGGLLNRLGKAKPSLTGEGEIMVGFTSEKAEAPVPNYAQLGVGLLITGILFSVARIIGIVVPIHYYAITIILAAVLKVLNVFPPYLVDAARQWYAIIVKIAIPSILLLIGIVYTDLNAVIQALSLQYIVICILTIIGAIIGAGALGKVVGFFPIESSIAAGLCMANMGGSGDVATLAAAKRMNLIPFAQVSSRLGGAVILVIASILVQTIFTLI